MIWILFFGILFFLAGYLLGYYMRDKSKEREESSPDSVEDIEGYNPRDNLVDPQRPRDSSKSVYSRAREIIDSEGSSHE